MADFDITNLILAEHDAFRRAFTEIEQIDDSGEAGRRWRELAQQLEVHAAGEEAVFYPALLRDVDDSEGETEHAVKDHNEIREATRKVDEHAVGTDDWRAALAEAREATVGHLDEEENDVLPPFQDEVPEDRRTELGMRWLQFLEQHEGARGLSGADRDPEDYVEENSG
jgi:hemerythrin-like domain-containing protein